MFIDKFILGLVLGIFIGVVGIIVAALLSDFIRRKQNERK